MIALWLRFGRSAPLRCRSNIYLTAFTIVVCLLGTGVTQEILAIGSSGWYVTKAKFEYQYTDYNRYKFRFIESEDSIRYEYIDPYIKDFPEHRALTKVVQAFGPQTILELRYEYSDLTSEKDQGRYYARFEKEVAEMTSLYGVYQYLDVSYDSPDSSASGGYMLSLGAKHDRSGWIKGEMSFSYDHNRTPSGFLVESYMPMAQIRWSVNSITALNGRWDGFWSVSDSGTVPAHAFTIFVSRYLPTQTALHLFSRFYYNDYGINSVSPAVEVAQYILWNLTLRLNYRYYQNRFESDVIPDFIKGRSIKSHSVRAYLKWQVRSDINLHLKLRRYISNQDIRMNTYLLGFEFEI